MNRLNKAIRNNPALIFILAWVVGFTLWITYNLVFRTPEDMGIVILKGYPEGSVICGEGDGPTNMETQEEEYHMWHDMDGNLWTINYGHLKDPEIKQLQDKVTVVCGNLKKESK